VRRPEIAEDLVQETFFAAVRTSGSFRGKSSERSWLCSILKNKICDYFRELGRETSFTDLEFLNDELSHKFVPQGQEAPLFLQKKCKESAISPTNRHFIQSD
jgi:DNA-directed RNA polymerase specialized sigma24 family protein